MDTYFYFKNNKWIDQYIYDYENEFLKFGAYEFFASQIPERYVAYKNCSLTSEKSLHKMEEWVKVHLPNYTVNIIIAPKLVLDIYRRIGTGKEQIDLATLSSS